MQFVSNCNIVEQNLSKQLETEQMRLAALLIRQGVVAEVIRGRKDCAFGQASRQLARFQEDQASQRRVCKQEQEHEQEKYVGSKSPTSLQE